MSFNLNNSRRDDKRIKSRILGQKPTCIIQVYPWENPSALNLAVLNLTKGDSFTGGNNAGHKAGGGRQPYIIDNDVVRCTINKDKNSSSGGFSLILKRGNKGDLGQKVSDKQIDYLSSLSPGDWITIYMKSDGKIDPTSSTSDSGLKLLGIIENVRYVEIDDPTLGRPRLEYVITGRDFGKIFESDIYFNPVIMSDPGFQKLMGVKFNVEAFDQFGKSSNKTPDQIIKSMVNFYLGGGLADASVSSQQWYIPSQLGFLFNKGRIAATGSLPFFNILNTDYIGLQNHNAEGKFLEVTPLLGGIVTLSAPSTGTVWQALQSYGNMCLNEFVVDLKKTRVISEINGKINYTLEPAIQFRQVPYSNRLGSETSPFTHGQSGGLSGKTTENEKTHFINLPRHVIQSVEVKQKNVGKSDFERVNTISVVPSFFNLEPLTLAYRMAVNIPSVQRYGSKLLNVQTSYAATSNGSDFLAHSTKCVSLLTDWFMTAHLLYNGTIVTTGTDEFVEVGQNLFIEDISQLFHIEGISYTYEINQTDGGTTYNTEFRVSRGQRIEGGVAKFIDSNVSLETKEVYSTVVSNTLENIRNNEPTK